MIADRLKTIRQANNISQTELAKQLGITRSSVNAWEQGISVPSTQYVIELAQLFKISTDYLLNVNTSATLDLTGLNEQDIEVLYYMAAHLRNKNHIK